MKDTFQIGADCGLLASDTKILNRVMDQVDGSKDPYAERLEEIIGALYRRIEKLEEDRPKLVQVWGGHGEGALYVSGKKVSDYFTCGESDIVEALGFTPESRRANEYWFKEQIKLPENLDDCILE